MSALQWLRFVSTFGVELAVSLMRWLFERPVRLLILALVLLALWLWIGRGQARDLAADRRQQADAWHGLFVEQKTEMLKFVALVRWARIEAAARDRANVERVRTQWTAQVSEVKNAYEADLAAARAAVDGRMRQASGTGADGDPGSGGGARMPAFPVLSTGALRPGEAAIVDRADIDAVTDNTLRLEHLIDAWRRAAAIDVNGQP